jgi:hypothetical protein
MYRVKRFPIRETRLAKKGMILCQLVQNAARSLLIPQEEKHLAMKQKLLLVCALIFVLKM